MKKRLCVFSIILALLVVMTPTGTLAEGNSPSGWTHFTAPAAVSVTDLGESYPSSEPRGPLVYIHTSGETVAGTVGTSSEWPELEGATFTMVHDADVTLNMASFTLVGHATGSINLENGDGSMQGNYKANIRGKFRLTEDGESIIYEQVFDIARWDLNGTSGVFDKVQAKGVAFATLDEMLSGTMNLS
ncbi:hypothetical protein ACFLUS_04000, partial [Chloroflexota bacterium]